MAHTPARSCHAAAFISLTANCTCLFHAGYPAQANIPTIYPGQKFASLLPYLPSIRISVALPGFSSTLSTSLPLTFVFMPPTDTPSTYTSYSRSSSN